MDVTIRFLHDAEVDQADQLMKLAFGTFLGMPSPTEFMGDATYLHHRQKTMPQSTFAAVLEDKIIGSNVATAWGSFAFFGPLTVHPDYWEQKIAQKLIDAALKKFDEWQVSQGGLFTFPSSPKHLSLYEKFGFYPGKLTYIMEQKSLTGEIPPQASRFSQLSPEQQQSALAACRQLTEMIYPGLDLTLEIQAVLNLSLGDTVLVWEETGLAAFAICHCGPRTEAGSGACYIKFAAVRPGKRASQCFEQLMNQCEGFAAGQGLGLLSAGVNTSHIDAVKHLRSRGYRPTLIGVAMHRPDQPGFNRADVFVLNDWR